MIKPPKSIRTYLGLQELFPGTRLQSDAELMVNQSRDHIDPSYLMSIVLEPHQKELLDQAAAKQLMCGWANQRDTASFRVEGTRRHPSQGSVSAPTVLLRSAANQSGVRSGAGLPPGQNQADEEPVDAGNRQGVSEMDAQKHQPQPAHGQLPDPQHGLFRRLRAADNGGLSSPRRRAPSPSRNT